MYKNSQELKLQKSFDIFIWNLIVHVLTPNLTVSVFWGWRNSSFPENGHA
jgi:hypothetical protein